MQWCVSMHRILREMVGVPCPPTHRWAGSYAWPIVTAHPEHDAALFMYERRIEDRGIQRAGIARRQSRCGNIGRKLIQTNSEESFSPFDPNNEPVVLAIVEI